jgi:hypothetical protein
MISGEMHDKISHLRDDYRTWEGNSTWNRGVIPRMALVCFSNVCCIVSA